MYEQLHSFIIILLTMAIYKKWEYTAVEVEDSNYFHLLYQGRPIMNSRGERYSLCFIRDMGFEEVKEEK